MDELHSLLTETHWIITKAKLSKQRPNPATPSYMHFRFCSKWHLNYYFLHAFYSAFVPHSKSAESFSTEADEKIVWYVTLRDFETVYYTVYSLLLIFTLKSRAVNLSIRFTMHRYSIQSKKDLANSEWFDSRRLTIWFCILKCIHWIV